MSCHVSKRFPCAARHCSFNRNNYPMSDNASCAPETKVVVRGKNTHDLTKAVINRDCAPSNLRFESAVERTSRQIEIHRFSESRSSRSKTSLVPPFAFYNYSRDSLFIARETHSNPCTFEKRRALNMIMT